MNNVFFDGDIFGIVDNGILAILAIVGIDLDKKLGGSGVMGGLFGANIGNSLSDLLAAFR
jgi:hypothetical protein